MDTGQQQRTLSVPLHRVAFIHPFAEFLTRVGAPVESGFQRAGLPFGALEDLDNYVPSSRFWAFLVDMAQREGIEDLGFRVGETYGPGSADPHLGDLLRQSPTLCRGLLRAIRLINKTISHCQMGLTRSPDGKRTLFYHIPSCAPDHPAVEQIAWFGITAVLGMVRPFTGPDWQPSEIGVMTHRRPGPHIREAFPATQIRPSPLCSYIALENELLGLSPLNPKAPALTSAQIRCEGAKDDLTGSLKQALRSYISESRISVELAAGLSETSTRTLQRRLAAAGTSFSRLLEDSRLELALQLLSSSEMPVTEIAYFLGYSDPSHFSRAFRRMAGVSPRAYRRASRQ